jgi:PAS domain S-box-containing protein
MVETRFLRKDGRIIQALLSSTPIDPDDLSVGVTFTALDITDRKLADQALQASEAGYKTLFEEASDAIFVSDLYGRILAVNDHACEQLGYDRNALQELKLNDLLAPEFAVNSQEQIAEIVKSGHIVIETAHVHRDGRIIPIELSATIIEYEGETAVLGIARDMTKRLEEQNALEANEARLRKIFEAVPVGVGMVQDRVIIFANEAICRMLGYTHEALINQPARILYADDAELERVGRIKYPILVKEGTAVIETQFKHIDNQVIDVRMRSALIDPEDISAGVISLIINITEQKKSEKELTQYREHLEALVAERTAEIKQRVAEVEQLNRGMLNLLADLQATNEYVSRTAQQLEETNAELESFAYSVSHDLRAPLRHISGFVNLLQADAGDQLDEQSTYYLQVINKAAIKMGQLIDDLLAFSRMGRKELVKKRVNMNELLAEVQQQFTQDIGNRDVIWKIESLSEVMADPALLRQVWANLLENALKYTRIRPTTSIEIGQMPPGENNEVIFFVRDNGVGFDNRYIDKLFGVFQRLHRDEEFEGTGIGLATVRRIIHRHNGRVWAEGKIDKGATFFFTLPTSKNTISTKEIS